MVFYEFFFKTLPFATVKCFVKVFLVFSIMLVDNNRKKIQDRGILKIEFDEKKKDRIQNRMTCDIDGVIFNEL